MAQVVYSPNALANLERVFDFLADRAPDAATAAVAAIRSAVEMLAHHPLIGRIVYDAGGVEVDEYRELVISYGKTGYLALYRFVPQLDEVRILAIRHQRELDYP